MKVISRIFNFLANLKVAIVLLLMIAMASAVGTAIPQGESIESYIDNYSIHPWLGLINGNLLLFLELDHVYSSFWFLSLLLLLGISLMICSWKRQWPTLKAALNWIDYKKPNQIQKLAISESTYIGEQCLEIDKLGTFLTDKGWKVQENKNRIAARKGVLGRFGPPLVHFGLIFLMIGATLGSIKGEKIENFLIPGRSIDLISPDKTNRLEVKLEKFFIQRSPSGQPEQFTSFLELNDAKSNNHVKKEISVNHPLRYKGITAYQADWALSAISLKFENSPILQLPLIAIPEFGEQVWGVVIPDLNDENKKTLLTVSNEAGPIKFYDQSGSYIDEIYVNKEPKEINGLTTTVLNILPSSGILIKYDPGVPLVYLGFAVTLFGSLISVISTKLLWIIVEDQEKVLYIGGRSNRNLSGFAKEFPMLLQEIKILNSNN